jgi:mannose-1-phosphate guanylyltransferase / mannose-6-phosphate isomerase
MSKPQITPVHLCGGSGTRLWPLSRKSYPKQFAPLLSAQSLFQASAVRVSGVRGDLDFAPPVVITGSDYRFIVTEQLLEAGVDPGTVLIEPDGRNTAPAVLAAALHVANTDPDAILLVVPSDHVIPDADAFAAAVARGLPAVAAGQLVTFGITPTRAETGYGWLELDAGTNGDGPRPLTRFVEKPDADTAAEMLEAGHFLWNAGIFLFAARDIIAAFDAHAPQLTAPVRAAVAGAQADLGFLRLDPAPWKDVEAISVDYAVMEKADDLAVVPFGAGWSDLGSWDAVAQELDSAQTGLVTTGPATAIECEQTLLRAESGDQQVVGIGLKDIVVVAMPDAVLVADRARTQDVKLAVEALRAKGATQSDIFPRDHRPWGHFETLALADRFQVKRIVVKPGAALSLQSHVHRAEHWIVVSGTARVTVNDDVRLLSENQSVYVPLGAVHRMENPGHVPMVLIEVQTGVYLGEDDIIRYEDVYARGQGAKG